MGIKASAQVPAGRPTNVADALFTKVQQRVLGILFGNAGRSFYANEIIALAGSGSGAVQRELARLESAGLLTVSRVGNQKHYQADTRAAVFPELCALVMKTAGLADVLRSALAAHADDIRAAFVYGSVAKREDTASSDIDLLVVSASLGYADLFAALEDAAARLGRKVDPTIYTPADLGRRVRERNAFVTRVLAQPKIWVIGGENDLAP